MPMISAHVEIGGGLGQHVRRVGDDDARARARRHVDVVVADRDVGDDLQVGRGVHHVASWRRQHADDTLLVLQSRLQLVLA